MSTWNYRVLHTSSSSFEEYKIIEVFYDDAGGIEGWSSTAADPTGSTLANLQADINNMLAATAEKILVLVDGDLEEIPSPVK